MVWVGQIILIIFLAAFALAIFYMIIKAAVRDGINESDVAKLNQELLDILRVKKSTSSGEIMDNSSENESTIN